jgi:hypothetical protein
MIAIRDKNKTLVLANCEVRTVDNYIVVLSSVRQVWFCCKDDKHAKKVYEALITYIEEVIQGAHRGVFPMGQWLQEEA